MKQKFSTHWIESKQPRKKRKYIANAPLHLKRKMLSSNLSKELRKTYGKRSISVRKSDIVKVMIGNFKGKKGKITIVNLRKNRIAIEGIQRTKKDGTKINVFFNPSNLQIQELNLEDAKRIKSLERKKAYSNFINKEKGEEKNVYEKS